MTIDLTKLRAQCASIRSVHHEAVAGQKPASVPVEQLEALLNIAEAAFSWKDIGAAEAAGEATDKDVERANQRLHDVVMKARGRR